MRDIKFRVWDKINKIMINSYEEASELEDKRGIKGEAYTSDEYYPWSDIKAPFLIDILDEQFELMQYTGLKDKNGKEIYEGDIVKIHKHSYDYGLKKDEIGQIKFMDGAFGFYREKTKDEYYFNDLATESGYGELDYYEVIGNIYENKNLLEKVSD